jgi:hypothetical protein
MCYACLTSSLSVCRLSFSLSLFLSLRACLSEDDIYLVFNVSHNQTRIFLLQDDAMIESLLCTLDIFTGLHFGPLTSRHFGAGGTGTGPESSNLLVEALDPLDGFDSFLQVRFKKKLANSIPGKCYALGSTG